MIKNLNEMEHLNDYIYSHKYNPNNQTIIYSFIAVDHAMIIFENKCHVFICRQEYPYNKNLEFMVVSVYDYLGDAVYDKLYGICEDNEIPCKNEQELIGILETISKL